MCSYSEEFFLGRKIDTMEDDIPISISIFNILLIPVVLGSSIVHGLVAYIYLSKKYGKVSQVKILYAWISIVDIFNMTLQTLLLPICSLRLSWFKVIVLYIMDSVEYSTVYLTCLVAFHIYYGMSKPFKYHAIVTSGNKYLHLQMGIIVAISLVFPPAFNSYEHLTGDDNTTIMTHGGCQYIQSHQFEMTERNQFTKYEKSLLMQIFPLSVGFSLAFRATCIIWEMKELQAMPKEMSKQLRQSKRNKGLMIIAVLVTITLAIVPRTLYNITHQWVSGDSGVPIIPECNLIYIFLTALYFVRFSANPIIYWFLGKDFHDGLKTILRSCHF